MERSRKKTHDPGEVLLNLAPDDHVIAPGVTLIPLGVGKIRGDNMGPPVAVFFSLGVGRLQEDSRPNDRPVTLIAEPLEHLRAEDLLGGRNKIDGPVGGAGRSSWIDVP